MVKECFFCFWENPCSRCCFRFDYLMTNWFLLIWLEVQVLCTKKLLIVFDMEICISSKIPLQKHSSTQCQRVYFQLLKSKFKFTERELSISTSTGTVCHKFCRKLNRNDQGCYMKHVEAGQPVLAVLAKFWTSHWVKWTRKKDFLHVPFISIHLIQMLAQHSLQAHLILMFQARVLFLRQLSLAVNLQRHQKPIPCSCKVWAVALQMLGSARTFHEQLAMRPRQQPTKINSIKHFLFIWQVPETRA